MGASSTKQGTRPAAELAGVWTATRKDLWKFDPDNYGPAFRQYERNFDRFSIRVDSDGTFDFAYGNMASGKGQWYCSEEVDLYTGYAKVLAVGSMSVEHGHETQHEVRLLDGDDVLEVVYSFSARMIKGNEDEGFTQILSGPSEHQVTEYFRRM